MATKTKAKSSASSSKKRATKSAPKKSAPAKKKEIPVDPTDDTQAVEGGFVNVVAGKHKGRYGVLISAPSFDSCVVRTRDDASERLVLSYDELEPAEPGGR